MAAFVVTALTWTEWHVLLTAEQIKPTAAAVAAGTAASIMLKWLFGNAEDQAKIEESTASFNSILTEQFSAYPDVVDIFLGGNNWPRTVAQSFWRDRGNDGHNYGKLLTTTTTTTTTAD